MLPTAIPRELPDPPPRFVAPPRCRAILQEVAEDSRIPVDHLTGHGPRRFAVSRARHHVFYRLRTELGWSYPKIAMQFGMDHSTVIWGVGCHVVRMFEAGDREAFERAEKHGVAILGKIMRRYPVHRGLN